MTTEKSIVNKYPHIKEWVEIQEKYKSLLNDGTTIKDQFVAYLIERYSVLFNQFKNLNLIRWSQYTPYFCDGEPCTFQTNISYPDVFLQTGEVVEGTEYTAVTDCGEDILRLVGEKFFEDVIGEKDIIIRRGGVNLDGEGTSDTYENPWAVYVEIDEVSSHD
jgi:hypothetical protein